MDCTFVHDALKNVVYYSSRQDDLATVDVEHVGHMSNILVMTTDISLRVTYLNLAAEELIGRSADSLNGKDLSQIFTDKNSQSTQALIRAIKYCLTTKGACQATVSFYTLSDPITIRFTAAPTKLNDQVNGVILVGHMLQKRKEIITDLSMELLAGASLGLKEKEDMKSMLASELARVIYVLDIDIAATRMIIPNNPPLLVCQGLDPTEAENLFNIKGRSGLPVHEEAEYAGKVVYDSQDDSGYDLPNDISSLAVYSLRAPHGPNGCMLFGIRNNEKTVRQYSSILQVLCNQINFSLTNHALNLELKKQNTKLHGLYETCKALSRSLDLDDILQTIMRNAMSLVGADNCLIFELDHEREKLSVLSMITSWTFDPTIELDLGEGLVGVVASTGKGILAPRAELDSRNLILDGMPTSPSSMIVVPLIVNNRTLGVMSLEKTPGEPFDHSQYELIEMFSSQAAIAMNNASLFSDTEKTASSYHMLNVLLTHDVANFNSPIHGYLEMLLKEPALDEKHYRYIRSALIQSENISELISDVRQMLYIRSNGKGWMLEPIDLIPNIQRALQEISTNVLYEDAEISFQTSVDCAMIHANSFIKDLFYNLLSNACKYGKGHPIGVDLELYNEEGSWWKITVEDCGWGIPDWKKDRLFKRFDHLDTSQAAEGHGLGLSVVAELVKCFGGKIMVGDRVEGDHNQGSIFTVLLPRY
ncbi:MAG: GAF domain-containing protein [Euryarchaeota archaeon]|mgnify:CR=1 FL=1|nr:GAF domain-containing protein [Euryarchaeota archaeon]